MTAAGLSLGSPIDCISVCSGSDGSDLLVAGQTVFTGRYWTGSVTVLTLGKAQKEEGRGKADLRAGVAAVDWLNSGDPQAGQSHFYLVTVRCRLGEHRCNPVRLAYRQPPALPCKTLLTAAFCSAGYPIVVSGSDDGSIDLWQYKAADGNSILQHLEGKPAHDHIVSYLVQTTLYLLHWARKNSSHQLQILKLHGCMICSYAPICRIHAENYVHIPCLQVARELQKIVVERC